MLPTYNTNALIDQATFTARAPEITITEFSASTFSGILTDATAWINNFCEVPTLLQSTIANEQSQTNITGMGDLIIYPMVRPIQSVQGINIVKGGFSTSLTLTNGSGLNYFQVPFPANKIIYPSSYLAGQGTLMIGGSQQLVTLRGANVYTNLSYTAGFPTVSGVVTEQNLIRAAVLVTKAILAERYNIVGANSFHQGDIGVSFKSASAYYDEAAAILNNGYRRVALLV